jgi:hypothetical protein
MDNARLGKTMFIKDMTDGHLRNAIFYLNKRCGELRGTAYQETPDMIWPRI